MTTRELLALAFRFFERLLSLCKITGEDLKRTGGGAVKFRRRIQSRFDDVHNALGLVIDRLHGPQRIVAPGARRPEFMELLGAAIGIQSEDPVRVGDQAIKLSRFILLVFRGLSGHEILRLHPVMGVTKGLKNCRCGREVTRTLRIREVAIHDHQTGGGAGETDIRVANLGDLGLVHDVMSFLAQGSETAHGISADAGDSVFLGNNDGGHRRVAKCDRPRRASKCRYACADS